MAGNIFTVTGGPIQITQIIGIVTTVVQTQANNTKLQFTDTASSTTTDLCAVLNISAAAVGTSFHIDGTFADAMIASAGGTSVGQTGSIVVQPGILKLNCAASNTGQVAWYLRYKPLSTSSTVVAD